MYNVSSFFISANTNIANINGFDMRFEPKIGMDGVHAMHPLKITDSQNLSLTFWAHIGTDMYDNCTLVGLESV